MQYERAKIPMNGKRMKTLYLLRHSGTLSTSTSGRDIDRGLSPDGIRDAEIIAEYIVGSSPRPQAVFISPAARARKTSAFVTSKIHMLETIVPEIYEASTGALFEIVRSIDGGIDTALMVGHNPGFASLVEFFTEAAVSMNAPAVAKIEFDIDDWRNAERYKAELADLYSPVMRI